MYLYKTTFTPCRLIDLSTIEDVPPRLGRLMPSYSNTRQNRLLFHQGDWWIHCKTALRILRSRELAMWLWRCAFHRYKQTPTRSFQKQWRQLREDPDTKKRKSARICRTFRDGTAPTKPFGSLNTVCVQCWLSPSVPSVVPIVIDKIITIRIFFLSDSVTCNVV